MQLHRKLRVFESTRVDCCLFTCTRRLLSSTAIHACWRIHPSFYTYYYDSFANLYSSSCLHCKRRLFIDALIASIGKHISHMAQAVAISYECNVYEYVLVGSAKQTICCTPLTDFVYLRQSCGCCHAFAALPITSNLLLSGGTNCITCVRPWAVCSIHGSLSASAAFNDLATRPGSRAGQ
eukprot:3811227-Pleurochrysis_carterae.AAC.3